MAIVLGGLLLAAQIAGTLHDHGLPLQHQPDCETCLVLKLGDTAAVDFLVVQVEGQFTQTLSLIADFYVRNFLTGSGNRDPPLIL